MLLEKLRTQNTLGPVPQTVMINCTIDINRSSIPNCVLRKLAIDRNSLRNWALLYPLMLEKWKIFM